MALYLVLLLQITKGLAGSSDFGADFLDLEKYEYSKVVKSADCTKPTPAGEVSCHFPSVSKDPEWVDKRVCSYIVKKQKSSLVECYVSVKKGMPDIEPRKVISNLCGTLLQEKKVGSEVDDYTRLLMCNLGRDDIAVALTYLDEGHEHPSGLHVYHPQTLKKLSSH